MIKFVTEEDNKLLNEKRESVSGYVANKDGYLISQAITNRIEVFRTLSKADKEKYTNLVWDTSVQKYKDRDAEGETIQLAIQNYRLSTKSISNLQSSPFTITGTPPVSQ